MILDNLSTAAMEQLLSNSDLSIKDWAESNIEIGTWSKYNGGKLDLSLTPWVLDPIKSLEDPNTYRVVIIGNAGGSKSTIAETFLSYLIVNRPGDVLWYLPTEEMCKVFCETRVMRFLDNCKPVVQLYPTSINKKRNTAIVFPHMCLHVLAANSTNSNMRHVRYVIMDETHEYSEGMIGLIHQRTNSFTHNRKILEISTGANESISDQVLQAWKSGTQKEYMLWCKHCNNHFVPNFRKMVKWNPDHKNKDGSYNYLMIRDTTYLECPLCQHKYLADKDHAAENEVSLNSKPKYSEGVSGNGGIQSYRFNCVSTKFSQLGDIAVKFVQANEACKLGDYSGLENFVKRDLAEFWDEHKHRTSNRSFGKFIRDYSINDPWEPELKIMVIDCQEHHMPYIIRGFSSTPESRLLALGNAKTWEELREVQIKHGVMDPWVWVDSGFATQQVYEACVRFDWSPIKGDQARDGYRKLIKLKNGSTYYTISACNDTTMVSPDVMPADRKCNETLLIMISEGITEKIIDDFKCGKAGWWGVPKDVGNEYLQHLANVTPVPIYNNMGGFKHIEYVKKKPHDWYDCERYAIAAAYYSQLLLSPPIDEKKDLIAPVAA